MDITEIALNANRTGTYTQHGTVRVMEPLEPYEVKSSIQSTRVDAAAGPGRAANSPLRARQVTPRRTNPPPRPQSMDPLGLNSNPSRRLVIETEVSREQERQEQERQEQERQEQEEMVAYTAEMVAYTAEDPHGPFIYSCLWGGPIQGRRYEPMKVVLGRAREHGGGRDHGGHDLVAGREERAPWRTGTRRSPGSPERNPVELGIRDWGCTFWPVGPASERSAHPRHKPVFQHVPAGPGRGRRVAALHQEPADPDRRALVARP